MDPRYGKLKLLGGAHRYPNLVELTDGRLENSLVLFLCPGMDLIAREVKFATFLSHLSLNRGWKRCYLSGPNSLIVPLSQWIPQVALIEDREDLHENSAGYVELLEPQDCDTHLLASEEVFFVNFKNDRPYPLSVYVLVAIISLFLALVWTKFSKSQN